VHPLKTALVYDRTLGLPTIVHSLFVSRYDICL